MRKTAVAAAVVVMMYAAAARAADTGSGAWQFSIFTSNLSYAESSGQSQVSGGYGIALSKAWTPRWSSEIAVAVQQHKDWFTQYEIVGIPNPFALIPFNERHSYHVIPVDLTTQYRFTNRSRWTPYVTGGARYVAQPAHTAQTGEVVTPDGLVTVTGGFHFRGDRTSLQLGVGTDVRLTPHFGLRFDAYRLLRSQEVQYDPLTRGSIGLAWKF